jgi:DNA-binding Lrp family transcriptional regulator
LVRRNSYVKGKEIALALGRSGRGVTISSALRQLANMYEEKVSYRPRLVLNNYTGFETTAFLCKKSGKHGCAHIYWKLYKKKLLSEISSAFYLAGNYDFFVTTRKSSVDLKSIGLEISETTKFFDPIYTVPSGLNNPMEKCIRNFFNEEFVKKTLLRKTKQSLNWDDVDWKIYRSTRENLRKPLKQVSRETGESFYIIKKRLNQIIIPSCTIANFFFPLGYDYYRKIFLQLDSEYENSIVKALRKLPCTSYIYPLEKKFICVLFHEGIKYVLLLTRKMEEKGLAKDILLSVPLASIF